MALVFALLVGAAFVLIAELHRRKLFARKPEAPVKPTHDWEAEAKRTAERMWMDDPTAFFLHPEGPLSDTTPEEWVARWKVMPSGFHVSDMKNIHIENCTIRDYRSGYRIEATQSQAALNNALMQSHRQGLQNQNPLMGNGFGNLLGRGLFF